MRHITGSCTNNSCTLIRTHTQSTHNRDTHHATVSKQTFRTEHSTSFITIYLHTYTVHTHFVYTQYTRRLQERADSAQVTLSHAVYSIRHTSHLALHKTYNTPTTCPARHFYPNTHIKLSRHTHIPHARIHTRGQPTTLAPDFCTHVQSCTQRTYQLHAQSTTHTKH